MTELADWLRQQLDEDERVAREASAGPWRYDPTKHHREPGTVRFSEGVFTGPAGQDATCVATTGETDDPQSMADAEHIARWDPARVLAEIEAKRRILDDRDEAVAHAARDFDMVLEGNADALNGVVRLLAQPYAGQPGWREDWAA